MVWGWCRPRRPLKYRRQSLYSYMHSSQRETSSDIAQGSYSDHSLEWQVILSWRELSLIAVVSNAADSQSMYSLIKDCLAEQFETQTFRVWCSAEMCHNSWGPRSLDEVSCSHSGILPWEVVLVPRMEMETELRQRPTFHRVSHRLSGSYIIFWRNFSVFLETTTLLWLSKMHFFL